MTRPPFWTAFTDSSGESYSFSRISAGLALVFIIAWACFVVWFKHEMPDLVGAGVFWGIIYGVNRAGESYDKKVATDATVATITPPK